MNKGVKIVEGFNRVWATIFDINGWSSLQQQTGLLLNNAVGRRNISSVVVVAKPKEESYRRRAGDGCGALHGRFCQNVRAIPRNFVRNDVDAWHWRVGGMTRSKQ